MSHRIFDLPDDIREQLTTLYLRPEGEALLYATNHNYPPRKLGGERGSALLASMLLHYYYNGKEETPLLLQDNQIKLVRRIAEDRKIRITTLPVPQPRSGAKSDYWAAAESAVVHVLQTHKEASDHLRFKSLLWGRDWWDLKSLALSGDDASNQNNHTILTQENGNYFPLVELCDASVYGYPRIKHLCLHNLKLRLEKKEALVIKKCLSEEICLVHLRLRLSEQNALKLYDCFELKRFVFSQHPDDEKTAASDGFKLKLYKCPNLRRVEASAALARTRVDPTLRPAVLQLSRSGKEGEGLDIYAAGVWDVSVASCYAKVLSLYRLKDRASLTHLGLRVEFCSDLEQVSLPRDLNLVEEGKLEIVHCDKLAKIALPDQLRCQKAELLFYTLDSLSELSQPALWEITGDGYKADFRSCHKLETIGLPTHLACQKASVELHSLDELRELVLPARFGAAALDLALDLAVEGSCLRLKVESCPRLQSIRTASAPATKVKQRQPDLTEIRVSRYSSLHEDGKGAADLQILATGVNMHIELVRSDIKTLFLSPDQKKMKDLTLYIRECQLLEQVCLSTEVSQKKFVAFIADCKQLENFILPQLRCKEAGLGLESLKNLQSLCLESAHWRVKRKLTLAAGFCYKLETIRLPKNLRCQKAELCFGGLPLLKDFSMPEGWDISQELKVTFTDCPGLQSFTVPSGFQCRGRFTLDFSGNSNMPKLNVPKLHTTTKWCKRLVVRRPITKVREDTDEEEEDTDEEEEDTNEEEEDTDEEEEGGGIPALQRLLRSFRS